MPYRKQSAKTILPAMSALGRAAVYVRMSTENQKYSITNQLNAITQYALLHDIEIAKVYEDAAKSGLTLKGRAALNRLFEDVTRPERDFDQILVYDVSRWGRFQDTDESAHYEFQCRQHGVRVVYCEEQFANDGSPLDGFWKNMKRAMAADFSREYSEKVIRTLCVMARRGYFTGGHTIYGLERVAVDEMGTARGKLAPGHRKSVRSDHVVLQPGAKDEVRMVRKVFRLYADKGWSPRRIAEYLNKSKVPSLRHRHWHPATIRTMLMNEKYIGVAHFNHTTRKLRTPVEVNDASKWIRTPGAYKPLISRALFARAQAMRKKRARKRDTEWMLDKLRRFARAQTPEERQKARAAMSSRNAYAHRFGSMRSAFDTIGVSNPPSYHVFELGNRRFQRRRALLEELTDRVARCGGQMVVDKTMHEMTVNDRLQGRFELVWSYETAGGQPRWRTRFWELRKARFFLLGRVLRDADVPVDYYLIPACEIGRGSWRSGVENGELDIYRHRTLASVAKRIASANFVGGKHVGKQLLGADHPKGGPPRKHHRLLPKLQSD